MNKIKIILVDDHEIVRDGIKSLLLNNENIEIISEASNSGELYKSLESSVPDLIIMDISLPGKSGIEITKELSEESPELKVLILSMFTEEEFIFNAIKAGAKGYLPKNSKQEDLIKAINIIQNGEEFFSPLISEVVMKSYIKKIRSKKNINPNQNNLSARELEVLKLIAEGITNKEISEKLFISIRTVETHKTHILQKLNLKSTVDLVKYAIKNEIIRL